MITEPRTLLLASSDRLFCDAAAAYLHHRVGWAVVTAGDGMQALAAVVRTRPSIVLVIGDLARLNTAAFARQVQRRWPETPVVVLGDSRGEVPVALPPTTRASALLAAMTDSVPGAPTREADSRTGDVELLKTLTKRELRILRLLSEGLGAEDIARRLTVSKHTIRTHLQNLYRKLGVHSRLEVVRFAARHGLLAGPVDDRS